MSNEMQELVQRLVQQLILLDSLLHNLSTHHCNIDLYDAIYILFAILIG